MLPLLLDAICIIALQTHDPSSFPSSSSSSSSIATNEPKKPLSTTTVDSTTIAPLDRRRNLVFTFGDCLLPFLLTCKSALSLMDDVLLAVSISPCGRLKRTLLMTAVMRNDLSLVRRICGVCAGWNMDAESTDNMTALTYAASLGRGEAVRLLLDAGADPLWACKGHK